jgi:hypothetical protein
MRPPATTFSLSWNSPGSATDEIGRGLGEPLGQAVCGAILERNVLAF